jgi:hypothetical protein
MVITSFVWIRLLAGISELIDPGRRKTQGRNPFVNQEDITRPVTGRNAKSAVTRVKDNDLKPHLSISAEKLLLVGRARNHSISLGSKYVDNT